MEASLPFAPLGWQKYFPPSVEISEPLRILWVFEVRPGVLMHLLKPLHALLVPGQFISLEQRNQCFQVYPPKLLVPFQLLRRITFAVHEVIDTSVLPVPAIVEHGQGYILGFLYQLRTIQALTQIHDEPHGFDGMTRN